MTANNKSKYGKVALVTGAARGIGHAFAMRLASEGASIVAADREDASDLAADLLAAGAGAAMCEQIDVSDAAQIAKLSEAIFVRFGRCDIIVNNAGVSPRTPFLEISLEKWRETMAINVESGFLICQALVPRMIENRYGRIVNIASDTFGLVIEGFAHYMASKGAVIGLTRALASDFGGYGITANCIAPGLTKTPNTEQMHPDGKLFDQIAQAQAIKRPGMPEDLIGAMSFLTSDDAAFFTGQTMVVNGGLLRAL